MTCDRNRRCNGINRKFNFCRIRNIPSFVSLTYADAVLTFLRNRFITAPCHTAIGAVFNGRTFFDTRNSVVTLVGDAIFIVTAAVGD